MRPKTRLQDDGWCLSKHAKSSAHRLATHTTKENIQSRAVASLVYLQVTVDGLLRSVQVGGHAGDIIGDKAVPAAAFVGLCSIDEQQRSARMVHPLL